MSYITYLKGHTIYLHDGVWTLNGEAIKAEDKIMCMKCKKFSSQNDVDPCFGEKLPGVKYACCGHGVNGQGYIKFENGITIKFNNLEVCK